MATISGLNILLAAVGSTGDVHPLVGLGHALASRGHEVTLIANDHFRPMAERAGLDFASHGKAEDYLAAARIPDLHHPRSKRWFPVLSGEFIVPAMRPTYEAIAARYEPGRTVVGAGALAVGARIAQEKLDVPMISLHYDPAFFRSNFHTAMIPQWVPPLMKAALFRMADVSFDRILGAPVNEFRAALELPHVSRVMHRWWHSTDTIAGLFPDWFTPHQADWPANTRLTGFPLFDELGMREIPDGARRFMEAGEPPIVFTGPSWMQGAKDYFATSVAACEQLGRRGILLTSFDEQVPKQLPDTIGHFEFIPFTWLLSQCAALVQHGGIGTTAHALRHAVPQLVVPISLEEPYLASRVKQLGVGDSIRATAYRTKRVAAKLDRILTSPSVAAACREYAARCEDSNAVEMTCNMIEALAGQPSLVAPI